MNGYVVDGLFPILPVRVRGIDGSELDLPVIVDTGFTGYLALPAEFIEALRLPNLESTEMILADGSVRIVNEYSCQIRWNNEWRSVSVQDSEGMRLLGMSLLRDYSIWIEVSEHGDVTIDPLDE